MSTSKRLRGRGRVRLPIAVASTMGAILVPSILMVAWELGHSHPRDPGIEPVAHAAVRAEPPPGAVEASNARISLGKRIFFDPALSEPPGTSCASCHDPAHGFAGNNGSTLGVARGSRPGELALRNTPSVLYLRFVRPFHLHWEEDAPLVDAFGGFFWDGRTDSLVDLLKQPLLNPNEMNGGTPEQVVAKVRKADYAEPLRAQFSTALDDGENVLRAMGEAVAAYLTSPEMSPFSSKYDEVLRGHATFSADEARGLALFKDSAKGGCAGCHKLNDTIPNPERSLFTDYGYDGVAPPRNQKLPRNADPTYFDKGLCQRPDTHFHTDSDEFCGAFRTPSLRNVALRPAFMHNGVFSKLRDAVAFYATRATTPKRWYPSGVVFDDVPEKYREYVNVDSAPYNRHPGEAPALDDREIDAVVAFLETLTDAR